MASDPESLNSDKVTTSNRMFKICSVLFSLACVSAIAYAGVAGSPPGADGRRLAVCAADTFKCNGGLGFKVHRVPELNCAFAPCPGDMFKPKPNVAPAAPPHDGLIDGLIDGAAAISGTTLAPARIGLIVGASVAGAAAIGGIVAGVVLGKPKTTVPPPVVTTVAPPLAPLPVMIPVQVPGGNRLYAADDKPIVAQPDIAAKVGSDASQCMFMAAAAFVFLGCLFLGISGFIYVKNKSTRVIKVEEDAEALVAVEEE